MPIDPRLAAKGRKEPLPALVAQARYSVGLAQEQAAALAEHAAWQPADTAALASDLELLDTEAALQADARGQSKGKTASQEAAVTAAKAFKRKVDLALPRVLRLTRVPAVSAEQFQAGEPIGRSVPTLLGWLTKVTGPLGRLAADFAPYFQPDGVMARHAQVTQDLQQADQTQEVALTALPADTQALYERKGRVLQAIEDLNRAGKIAFDGQAEQAGRFHKDILLRGRKVRVVAPVPEPV